MDAPADIAFAVALVAGAGVFVFRRFTSARKPPSCAPDAKAKPQVIVGATLARGMAAARKKRGT